MRYGIDELIGENVELVHGPGCPVCVTPIEIVDKAIAIASRPDVIFVSYGDMLRVPGTRCDLFRVKAEGGDVRIAYSPMEAVKIARANPDRKVVFFGIGFETTAPANAMAVWKAREFGLTNFSELVSHVLVPPAIRLLLQFSRQSRAGLHRARPRLHRHGLLGVQGARATNSTFPSWSAASSRWICWKPSRCWSRSSKTGAPKWRINTRAP